MVYFYFLPVFLSAFRLLCKDMSTVLFVIAGLLKINGPRGHNTLNASGSQPLASYTDSALLRRLSLGYTWRSTELNPLKAHIFILIFIA